MIVDFWAAWCGPCRALTPVLEREVESRAGAVELAKVDVDANPGLSAQHRVQGIPAVKAYRDGRVVSEFVGVRSPTGVASFIDELLAPPRLEGLLEELRASGELPDVVSALEAGDESTALDHILAAVAVAPPTRTGSTARGLPSRSSTISGRTTRSQSRTASDSRRRSTDARSRGAWRSSAPSRRGTPGGPPSRSSPTPRRIPAGLPALARARSACLPATRCSS